MSVTKLFLSSILYGFFTVFNPFTLFNLGDNPPCIQNILLSINAPNDKYSNVFIKFAHVL